LANLLGEAISRDFDQPRNGGGNWFSVREMKLAWKVFDRC
jgi:hypothetical protein